MAGRVTKTKGLHIPDVDPVSFFSVFVSLFSSKSRLPHY